MGEKDCFFFTSCFCSESGESKAEVFTALQL